MSGAITVMSRGCKPGSVASRCSSWSCSASTSRSSLCASANTSPWSCGASRRGAAGVSSHRMSRCSSPSTPSCTGSRKHWRSSPPSRSSSNSRPLRPSVPQDASNGLPVSACSARCGASSCQRARVRSLTMSYQYSPQGLNWNRCTSVRVASAASASTNTGASAPSPKPITRSGSAHGSGAPVPRRATSLSRRAAPCVLAGCSAPICCTSARHSEACHSLPASGQSGAGKPASQASSQCGRYSRYWSNRVARRRHSAWSRLSGVAASR
ncbi:MAG: hypothetical protein BWY76_00539 [bacterium ADurb.Bin429]|nr:MAG: hypothetical protein BWY76_00539 [bacterium ADurb.Bin429]